MSERWSHALQADQTYMFHLTAFLVSQPYVAATVRVKVTVQASPLRLAIAGGSEQVVSAGQGITVQVRLIAGFHCCQAGSACGCSLESGAAPHLHNVSALLSHVMQAC